jgi:hypothetical protein
MERSDDDHHVVRSDRSFVFCAKAKGCQSERSAIGHRTLTSISCCILTTHLVRFVHVVHLVARGSIFHQSVICGLMFRCSYTVSASPSCERKCANKPKRSRPYVTFPCRPCGLDWILLRITPVMNPHDEVNECVCAIDPDQVQDHRRVERARTVTVTRQGLDNR